MSYLVGTGFVVCFLSSLAPRLLRVNLREESAKLEATLSAGPKSVPGTLSASRPWSFRTFRISDSPLAGKPVGEIERSFARRTASFSVESDGERRSSSLRRRPSFRPGTSSYVAARREVLLTLRTPIGEEVHDRELLDVPLASRDVVVTNRAMVERTLSELAEEHGRGVGLQPLIRGGEEIPFTPSTTVNRRDLLPIARRSSGNG